MFNGVRARLKTGQIPSEFAKVANVQPAAPQTGPLPMPAEIPGLPPRSWVAAFASQGGASMPWEAPAAQAPAAPALVTLAPMPAIQNMPTSDISPAIVALPNLTSKMGHAYLVFDEGATRKIVDRQVSRAFPYSFQTLTSIVTQTIENVVDLFGAGRVRRQAIGDGSL